MHSGSLFTELKVYRALYTYCCHVENLSSCLLENLNLAPPSASIRSCVERERKQEYLNPGRMYVREPARCLCCSSSPPAGMWICQDDRQPPTYLHAPPPSPHTHTSHPTLSLSYVTSNRTPLPVPYPQSPPTFTH